MSTVSFSNRYTFLIPSYQWSSLESYGGLTVTRLVGFPCRKNYMFNRTTFDLIDNHINYELGCKGDELL